MRRLRPLFAGVSLVFGVALCPMVSNAAVQPYFSHEIRALVEPCSALLMKDSLALERLESDEVSADLLRMRLAKDDIRLRFKQEPQFGVAVFLTGVDGEFVPKAAGASTRFDTPDAAVELQLAENETVFGSARMETSLLYPHYSLKNLRFLGAVWVATVDEQPYFVFHLAAEVVASSSAGLEADFSSPEQQAIEFLRRGLLTPDVVLAARVFEQGQKRGDAFLGKLSRAEIAAMRRVLRTLYDVQAKLDQLPPPTHSLPLGRLIVKDGYRFIRKNKGGAQVILITREKDNWYWKILVLPDSRDAFLVGGEVRIKRLIHGSTNGSYSDIADALRVVTPFFPPRHP